MLLPCLHPHLFVFDASVYLDNVLETYPSKKGKYSVLNKIEQVVSRVKLLALNCKNKKC